MGLVIRLRHALGERMLELPERAVDQPLVIGRASTADVQIPSIHVGPEHLVLFVHEGHWVVQDAPGGTGTLINGEPLSGARALVAGDVLSLGSETTPPTITIDSEGYTPPVEVASSHLHEPSGGRGYAPPPLQASPYMNVAPEPAYAEPELQADWTTAATPQSYYVPKRRKSSDAAVAVAVVVTVAILAAAGVYVYTHRPPPPATVVIQQAKPKVDLPTSRPALKSIFSEKAEKATRKADVPPPLKDLTDEESQTPATMSLAATRRAPTTDKSDSSPAVGDSDVFGSSDTGDQSEAAKAFKIVESAYYNPDPAKALLTFDSYAEAHPDTHRTQLEQYRADMLDKIWWERIDSLFEKRKELLAAIRKTEQDIKDETEAAYKKTVLEPRLEDQKKRLAAASARITKDMAYTSPTAPPIGKDEPMRELRAKRDPKVYEEWCKRVLKHIRNTHGGYPWSNEK
jgi:hypothetical protein